jgi:RNA polymerase sigma-70 factor, ECF subfamily
MDSDHKFLMTRIAGGDKQALAALYRSLERPVYKFITSRLNDPHEANDILHEVFMDVWRSADRFEGRSKVQTWIFGIAYRKSIDVMRKRGRMDLTDETFDIVDDSPDAVTCLAAGQEAEHVRHCLETLKDDHKSAITLAFYQDMTYGEIAEVAGVPEGTIKTRIFHAKKLLMRCLSGRIERGVA